MKKITMNAKKVCVLVLSALMVVMAGMFFVSLKSNRVSATQQSGFYMTEGAQARLATDANDDSGIRFQAELTIDAHQAIVSSAGEGAVVYFGMEIYPADADIVADPTLVHDFTKIVHSRNYATGDTQYVSFPGGATVYKYTASITYNADTLKDELEKKLEKSLTEEELVAYLNQAYGTELTARAYYQVGEGEKQYVSNPQTRSIWGVATDSYRTDETTWDGEKFLLDKYFKEIKKIGEVDGRLNILPNGKIVHSAGITATDNLYYDSENVKITNGYIPEKLINSFDYGTDYNTYKVSATGKMEEQTTNKIPFAYQDELETGVLADFDEAEYVNSVFLTSGGSYSILTGEDLANENVGADSGILKVQPSSYDGVIVQFKETFKLGNIDKLYFRVRLNKAVSGVEFRVRLYDKDFERLGDLVNVPIDTADAWQWVILDVSKFTNANLDSFVGGIKLTFTEARVAYFDDIGWVKGAWIDSAIGEEGKDSELLATFNREEYQFNVDSVIDSKKIDNTHIYLGDDAVNAGSPSKTGVLSAALGHFNYLYIKLQKTFTLSEIVSIELDLKYAGALSSFRFGLRDANGNNILTNQTLANLGVSGYSDGAWNTISIPAEKIANYFSGDVDTTEIAEIILYNNVAVQEDTSGYELFVDEIRATYKFVDEKLGKEVIADFDEYGYKNLVTYQNASHFVSVDVENGTLTAKSTKTDGYINIPVREDRQFTLNELRNGITLKLQSSIGSISTARLYLATGYKEDGSYQYLAYGTSPLFSNMGVTTNVSGGITTITISPEKIKALIDTNKNLDAEGIETEKNKKIIAICFYPGNANTHTWTFDEISIDKKFEDTSLAYGVIADFDEAGYNKLVGFRNDGAFSKMMQDGDRNVLVASLPGGDSYIDIPVPADMQFSINDLLYGITFKLKTTIGSLASTRLYLFDENGESISNIGGATTFANLGVGVNASDYVTITISKAKLEQYWTKDEDKANLDKKIGQISVYSGVAGGTWYFDEVSVSKFYTDKGLDEKDGVIADFDEIGYRDRITFKYGSVVESLKDNGRDVLHVNLTAKDSYIYVPIATNQQFAINELTKGLAFTFKTDYTALGDVRLYLKDDAGKMIGGAGKYFKDLGVSGDASEYTTFVITKEKLLAQFGSANGDSKIAQLEILMYSSSGINTSNWYLDEISTVSYFTVDTEIEDNVIADFDEAGYEDLITFRYGSVVKSLKDNGRDVLHVKLTATDSYIYVPVPSDRYFTINELTKGLTIKFKTDYNGIGQVRLYLYDADGNGIGGGKYLKDLCKGYDSTSDGYRTLVLTKDKLLAQFTTTYADTKIAKISLLMGGASYNTTSNWYLDEVSFDKTAVDANTYYGVIADFNETLYEDVVYFKDGYVVGSINDEGRDVLHVELTASNSYIYIPVPSDMQFTINELYKGLTFKLKTNLGSLSNVRLYLYDTAGNIISGGKYFSNLGVGTNASTYKNLTITKEKLLSQFGNENADKKIAKIGLLTTAVSTWWLDEISISKPFTDTELDRANGVVADFNEGGYFEIVEARNGTDIVAVVQDGDRSVLKANTSATNHYIDLILREDLRFNIDSLTDGITITLRTTGMTNLADAKLYLTNTSGNIVAFSAGSNTFTLLSGQASINSSEYVTIKLTADLLKQYFTDKTSTVAKISIFPNFATETTWFIDEIAVK